MTAIDGANARQEKQTRAIVIGPYLSDHAHNAAGSMRSVGARLAEAGGLARAIDLDIVVEQAAKLDQIRPSTFLGKGKVEQYAKLVEDEHVELAFLDCSLTPVQQRNLEKAFNTKVIDRTGLILEIFGRRARTREGSLQVELAHLAYQKSRLVRSWTHLERQRGGFGFLGGPGETQIETDRRLISERMVRVEAELSKVKRTRALHRKSRQDVPFPTVALVGYTNAGKSTLFNRLTRSQVMAEDMLFATLDPTLRRLALPHGGSVILSDTVGFISDLPTTLVSAFRATLEEVVEADVILHVRDIAHEDTEAQSADVEQILGELGIDPQSGDRLVEIWNKLDLLDKEQARSIENSLQRRGANSRPILVSALTGEGEDRLLTELENRIGQGRPLMSVEIPSADGEGLSWIYQHGEVLERHELESGPIKLVVRMREDWIERVRERFDASIIRPA